MSAKRRSVRPPNWEKKSRPFSVRWGGRQGFVQNMRLEHSLYKRIEDLAALAGASESKYWRVLAYINATPQYRCKLDMKKLAAMNADEIEAHTEECVFCFMFTYPKRVVH